ncbi:unnamed protein product [Fusarium equiseti]|uniref:Nephrocystin 3-like N-terminal domain-containing protein n=1 Tax=Fusarium equiseti TaxID=61235 RepID=A0A8J2IZF3_FUSEQ|nr:unnamed protein product [Fusarium equiseti]
MLFVNVSSESLNTTPMIGPRVTQQIKDRMHAAGQFMNTMATGDDAGVGEQMVKLQDLIEQEGRLSTALILASVLKIHKDVGAVRSIIEYSTSLTSQHVDKLKALLYIVHEPWNDAFRACAERCVARTGEWLLLDDKFNAWATTQNDAPHIFAIEAGSNFGKTYLTTTYFNSASKDLTAAAVVRAIVFQLCTHNTRFVDYVGGLPETFWKASSSLAIDLWTSIIVEVSSQHTELSVFIILDGLGMLANEQLQILSNVLASPNKAIQGLRILLAGNTRCLESVSRRVGHSLVKITLDNAYPHRGDVSLVAEAELARCEFFSDELDDPEVRECMARTRNSLVQAVSGDYYLLQSQIREIRHLWSIGEIDRVLNRAVKGRNATIERHLSNLAVRVSETELFKLRDGLHLLAVSNILDAPTPHIVVLEQYLASGRDSATSRIKVRTAYSGLVSIDTEGHLSLATDEMTSFLMPDMKASQAIASQTQTVNIKQAFYATFNPIFLEENGIDDEFFDSRSRLNHLAGFKVERNVAMARVAIHFIDCLSEISTTQRKQTSHENHPLYSLSTFAREVLPKLLHRIDISQLVGHERIDLGIQVTRLFCEDTVFDVFWPLEALSQAVTTWGENEQYFDAVLSWATELQHMSKASDLKIAGDIRNFFLWFSTVQELGLINKDVVREPYERERMTGWFTPPNWEKIKAWVLRNVEIDDHRASFDIQRAAVLLAFGGKSKEPAEILEPYRGKDWRANAWLAEATSLHDKFDAAFDAVEECLSMLLEFDVDQATITKVNDCFLDWIDSWESFPRNMQVREKMMKLNEQKPGILSPYMWAQTLEIAFYAKGRDAGLNFFQAQYQSRKPTICEAFIRHASYNYLHVPLSRTLADDPEGSRLRYLCGIYKDAIAFCDEKPMLSPHDMHRARVRLSYWLGRFFFVSKGNPKLNEAIAIWEGLLKDFSLNPSTRDLDILIPIIKHLCSAYIQVLRGGYTDIEADHIISQVIKLHNVTRSSQEPIALKLYFRVSLCLARIYVVHGEAAKAREILKEHADSAFSMLSQRNNLSLFSIGWLYLASILTVLDQDDIREKWAWSKFRLLQEPRLRNRYFKAIKRGDNPSLDITVKQRIDAIKTSEEYNCFDSIERDPLDCTWADEFYLPWFATIACDGEDCEATLKKMLCQPAPINSEPLQRVDGTTFNSIYPPTSGLIPNGVTFRLEEGFLPPMGCSKDHSALIVPAAYEYDNDKDMEIVAEESKKWNTNSYFG